METREGNLTSKFFKLQSNIFFSPYQLYSVSINSLFLSLTEFSVNKYDNMAFSSFVFTDVYSTNVKLNESLDLNTGGSTDLLFKQTFLQNQFQKTHFVLMLLGDKL